jgi:hypothetical protein
MKPKGKADKLTQPEYKAYCRVFKNNRNTEVVGSSDTMI